MEEKNKKAEKKLERPAEEKGEPNINTAKAETAPEKKGIDKKKDEKEGKKKETEKVKKDVATVRGVNTPISTKTAYAICKFIKGKKIEFAIRELGEITEHKKALPMKGEIPHRRGRIMSGRFPENAIGEFVILLKSLNANASTNGIVNPVINESIAGPGSRPYGHFGRVRRKRTNIKIIAKEYKNLNNKAGKK